MSTDDQHTEQLFERELELKESARQASRYSKPQAELVKALADAEVFVWHGRQEDVVRLADELSRSLATEWADIQGRLYRFVGDHLVPQNNEAVRTLVAERYCSVRWVLRSDRHELERFPIDLSRQQVTDLISMIIPRCAKGPARSRDLSESERQQVIDRVRMGEAQVVVAKAYAISLEDIRGIMAAAAPRW
jgi:hypothetical protein